MLDLLGRSVAHRLSQAVKAESSAHRTGHSDGHLQLCGGNVRTTAGILSLDMQVPTEATHNTSRLSPEKRHQLPHLLRLLRPQPVPVVGIFPASGRATASSMKAADSPILPGRVAAALSCALGHGAAPGRAPEPLDRVHGVSETYHAPPSLTVTRSTRTTCCALARWRFSAFRRYAPGANFGHLVVTRDDAPDLAPGIPSADRPVPPSRR